MASVLSETTEYDETVGVETNVRTVQLHGQTVDVITKRKRSPEPDRDDEEFAVPAFDVSALEASAAAETQRAAYATALDAAVAAARAGVATLTTRPDLDASCDAALFGALVRGALPAVPADTSGVRTDTDRSYGFVELAARVAAVAKRTAGAKEGAPDAVLTIYGLLATGLDRASEFLRGTSNRAQETAVCRCVDAVFSAVDRYLALALPSATTAHASAVAASIECDVFEHKRATVDWSQSMIAEEKAMYDRVDAVVAELRAVGGACEGFFSELAQLREAIASAAAGDGEAAARAEQSACRDRVAQLERYSLVESVVYGKVVGSVQQQLSALGAKQSELVAAVADKSARIDALLAELAADQRALWEASKRQALLEAGLGALSDAHAANRASAAALAVAASAVAGDIEANIKAAHISERMGAETADVFTALVADDSATAIESLAMLLDDQMSLLSSKYHKTALCVFAANSRIEMRNQEREGMLVKKQRCNAAQDIEGVAACNTAVAEIEARIVRETSGKETLESELAALASQWGDAYRALGALPIDGAEPRLGELKAGWLALIAQLHDIEADQHRKMFLSDVLDASFLSQM